MSLARHFRHLFLPHSTNNQRAKLLHPTGLLLIIGIFLSFEFLINRASTAFPDILGFASQIPADEIIRLTNIQRQATGLPSLSVDSQLNAAAGRKAADMFARNYWAHVSPVGTQPWFFITEAGYGYRYAGENLARDFSDPQSVVNAWIASPTHKDNLLSNRYQDIGVAVVDGSLDGKETTLVVQMFGTKLSAGTSPQVGGTSFLTVQASEPSPVPTTAPVVQAETESLAAPVVSAPNSPISPFDVTKYFTFAILVVFAVILGLDVLIVNHKSIIRWTSKSYAHLIFVAVILIAATTVIGGRIL